MTQKECDRERGAHHLETTSGDIQDTERKRPSKRHSHPKDRIGRDKSGPWDRGKRPSDGR